jgi:hypothetical protein
MICRNAGTDFHEEYDAQKDGKGQGHAVVLLKYELKRSHIVSKLMGQSGAAIRLKKVMVMQQSLELCSKSQGYAEIFLYVRSK